MPALSLTSAEQAGVAAADSAFDQALTSGMNNPDTSPNTAAMKGYPTLASFPPKGDDQRPNVRLPWKLAWVSLVRVLASFLEGWTLVPASGPSYAFQNSWVNVGAPHALAGFRKDPLGEVRLKGRVQNGTNPAVIFTLPAGYRPAETMTFNCMGHTTGGADDISHIEVDASGNVTIQSGSRAWTSLDNVRFCAA